MKIFALFLQLIRTLEIQENSQINGFKCESLQGFSTLDHKHVRKIHDNLIRIVKSSFHSFAYLLTFFLFSLFFFVFCFFYFRFLLSCFFFSIQNKQKLHQSETVRICPCAANWEYCILISGKYMQKLHAYNHLQSLYDCGAFDESSIIIKFFNWIKSNWQSVCKRERERERETVAQCAD